MRADTDKDQLSEVELKAQRAKRILIGVMILFMVLPFVLVWATGSIDF